MFLTWMTMWMVVPCIQAENNSMNMFGLVVVGVQGDKQIK